MATRLPGAHRYVVFDPAAGLNRFDVVSDWYAGYQATFETELSFLQGRENLLGYPITALMEF